MMAPKGRVMLSADFGTYVMKCSVKSCVWHNKIMCED